MRVVMMWAACFAAVASSFNQSIAQDAQSYYVVVGAFSTEDRASQVTSELGVHSLDTLYSMLEDERFLQLHVVKTGGPEQARQKTDALLSTLDGTARMSGQHADLLASAGEDPKAYGGGSGAAHPAHLATAPPKPMGKYFRFQVASPEGRRVDSKLYHIDLEEGSAIATYEPGKLVDLMRPGETEPMTIICTRFGYRELPKVIDYVNPARTVKDAYRDENGVWVIPFTLERVRRGDVSLMPNVRFFEDAAVMQESSQQDLDELVRMMHSNPYYEITIHAHCNGRGKREIRVPAPDGSPFDLSAADQVQGRARTLTSERAEVIRDYLIERGIAPERVEVFSWGASDMLVKPRSEEAQVNDRIEIEFTRD